MLDMPLSEQLRLDDFLHEVHSLAQRAVILSLQDDSVSDVANLRLLLEFHSTLHKRHRRTTVIRRIPRVMMELALEAVAPLHDATTITSIDVVLFNRAIQFEGATDFLVLQFAGGVAHFRDDLDWRNRHQSVSLEVQVNEAGHPADGIKSIFEESIKPIFYDCNWSRKEHFGGGTSPITKERSLLVKMNAASIQRLIPSFVNFIFIRG